MAGGNSLPPCKSMGGHARHACARALTRASRAGPRSSLQASPSVRARRPVGTRSALGATTVALAGCLGDNPYACPITARLIIVRHGRSRADRLAARPRRLDLARPRAKAAGASSRAPRFRSWWWRCFGNSPRISASFRRKPVSVARGRSPRPSSRLTASGILPHHVLDTLIRLARRLRARRGRRRRDRHRDGTLAPGGGHLPAAGQHRRADPRPRLCAAVPALVRARQQARPCCWSPSSRPSRSSSTPGPA